MTIRNIVLFLLLAVSCSNENDSNSQLNSCATNSFMTKHEYSEQEFNLIADTVRLELDLMNNEEISLQKFWNKRQGFIENISTYLENFDSYESSTELASKAYNGKSEKAKEHINANIDYFKKNNVMLAMIKDVVDGISPKHLAEYCCNSKDDYELQELMNCFSLRNIVVALKEIDEDYQYLADLREYDYLLSLNEDCIFKE